MKTTLCKAHGLIGLLFMLGLTAPALAVVQVYEFPEKIPGIKKGSRWKMEVDGTPVRVLQLYTMGTNRAHGEGLDNSGPGAVALFSFEGTVSVTLTADEPITSYDIRPKSLGITGAVDGNRLTFTLERPGHCGVEINEDFSKPLFIYTNPLEVDKPDPDDPHVTFFEKGTVHEIGDMKLAGLENHTVYLEGGAVVLGNLTVRGSDYRVRGHGLLYSGPDSTRGPTILNVGRSSNAVFRDFTTITHWDGNYGCSVWNSDSVSFTNWRMLNTAKDGLNPMGTQNMTVDSCFLFGDDDASAIKTSKYTTQDAAFITFRNSQIWNNSIEIGYETHGGDIHDITYKNLDIIHVRVKGEVHNNYPLNEMSIHVNDNGTVYNVSYEDIRIESSLSNRFFEFRIIYAPYAAYPKNGAAEYRGHVRDVYLKNIRVIDGDNFPVSKIGGWDAGHLVENVGIEGLFIYGREILDTAAGKIKINDHTRNIGIIPLGRGDVAPDAPKDLTIGEVSGVRATLSWIDNSDNEWGFTIERKRGSGEYGEVGTVNFNSTSFVDTTCRPSTAYTYRVRSSNRAGFSDGGATATVTTPDPTGIGPAAPAAFTAQALNSTAIQLIWEAPSGDPDGYVIKRKVSSESRYAFVDSLDATTTAYNDGGLSAETAYDYRIVAFNHNGISPKARAAATTPAAPASATVVDEIPNDSLWFASENFETFTDKTPGAGTGYDTLRARRTTNMRGAITWAFAFVNDFEILFYHMRSLDNVKVYGSGDGREWYEIACGQQRSKTDKDGWFQSVFTPMSDAIADTIHFLRLEVGRNTANWNPQLSRVTISYGIDQHVGALPASALAGGGAAFVHQSYHCRMRFSQELPITVYTLSGRIVANERTREFDYGAFPAGTYILRSPAAKVRFVKR